MKIGITSDFHLGYGIDSARENDSFRQAKEALEKVAKADLVLIAGDIFDSRVPRQEVIAKALKLFKIGKPIVAIYGTHERRSKHYVNPVQLLEHAGFLKCLHCSFEEFITDGKKVKVYGMSGVPERYAKIVLEKWDPRPDGDVNILMLHQDIKEYIYNPLEPATLSLADLPKGFDLIVCGHIHWPCKAKIGNTHVVFPGSTIRTQLKKADIAPKRVWFYEGGELKSEYLQTQRKFFYKTLKFENETPSNIIKKSKEVLKGCLVQNALIKLKLTGTLNEKFQPSDVNLAEISKMEKDGIVISVTRNLFSKKQQFAMKKILELRQGKASVQEQGLAILEEYLKKDPEEIFNLLVDDKLEEAKETVLDMFSGEKND